MKTKLVSTLLAAILIVTSGCASTGSTPAQKEAPVAAQPDVTESEMPRSIMTDELLTDYSAGENADDRIVCSKRRPAGSRIVMTVCRTVAEIRLEAWAARVALSDALQSGGR